jgi:hypothetical protein
MVGAVPPASVCNACPATVATDIDGALTALRPLPAALQSKLACPPRLGRWERLTIWLTRGLHGAIVPSILGSQMGV